MVCRQKGNRGGWPFRYNLTEPSRAMDKAIDDVTCVGGMNILIVYKAIDNVTCVGGMNILIVFPFQRPQYYEGLFMQGISCDILISPRTRTIRFWRS